MSARILDGKRIAEEFRREVRTGTDALEREGRRRPGLAVVMVGDNAAYIVECVNQHTLLLQQREELREAIEYAELNLRVLADDMQPSVLSLLQATRYDLIVEKLAAALAKAVTP